MRRVQDALNKTKKLISFDKKVGVKLRFHYNVRKKNINQKLKNSVFLCFFSEIFFLLMH